MDDERDELIERVAAELRRPMDVGADFDARLMARVRREARPGSLAGAWAALRQPRPVMVSPVGLLALAAGVATLLLGVAIGAGRWRAVPAPVAALTGPAPVQFVLVVPQARSVALVGDFNDWDVASLPLTRGPAAGVWSVTVPLEPGRYRYTFVIDGTRWMADPLVPAVEDEFGRPNSVITVGEHGT